MKKTLGFLGLCLSFSVSAQTCISLEEAYAIAIQPKNIQQVREIVKDESSYWVPRQKIRDSLQNLRYSEEFQGYIASQVMGWDCAAGASCYIGAKVTCEGAVETYVFGD